MTNTETLRPQTIAVIGTGYLGAVHAAGLAEMGFHVIGYDIDEQRIQPLKEAKPPFYEPHFEPLLKKHVGKNLTFTTDPTMLSHADAHFICVGTPQLPGSNGADLTYVYAAVDTLAKVSKPTSLVIGKSTVPVGTCANINQKLPNPVAWNPEFLREGWAVEDTLTPDRLVFGVSDDQSLKTLEWIYKTQLAANTPVIVTDYETAELVKVAANSFLATKISFINAMSEVCEAAGADVKDLAAAIGLDDRIGTKFLAAGLGFGGGCLPKDIRAFSHKAGQLGVEDALMFLHQIDTINLRARKRVVEKSTKLLQGTVQGKKIACLGASFKPNSDDLRDSPALAVAEELHNSGANIIVHDPQALPGVRKHHTRLDVEENLQKALKDADLILLLTEWDDYKQLDANLTGELVCTKNIIDARNALNPAEWIEAGWNYEGMGRHII